MSAVLVVVAELLSEGYPPKKLVLWSCTMRAHLSFSFDACFSWMILWSAVMMSAKATALG